MESVEYEKRVQDQVDQYIGVEEIHDLPESFHYWSNEFLRHQLNQVMEVEGVNDFYARHLGKGILESDSNVIASLGSGDCTTEVEIAKIMLRNGIDGFRFDCLELSPHLIERAENRIAEHGLKEYFRHVECDINKWKPNEGEYAGFMAAHALHHFVNLEGIFEGIRDGLEESGRFVTHDMIGRNGHMRWPEALRIVDYLWRIVPDRYRFDLRNRRMLDKYVNWDCSVDGFEGIRAQDILPLLTQYFGFERFLGFSNLHDVFLSRELGHNVDVSEEDDRQFVNFLEFMTSILIDAGYLKPTQMFAVLRKEKMETICWRHWTPEFCVRDPEIADFDSWWTDQSAQNAGQ